MSIPKLRAFIKAERKMAAVAFINFDTKTVVAVKETERSFYTFEEVAIMQCLGVLADPTKANRDDPNYEQEWVYEDDIVCFTYEDPITSEERVAYGVVDLQGGNFGIDLPNHGVWIDLPDPADCTLEGNIWQPETWSRFDAPEFRNLLIQWLVDKKVIPGKEALLLRLDAIVCQYEHNKGIGKFANEDPDFAVLLSEYNKLDQKEREGYAESPEST
jgi:hypothetical protein